MQDLPYTTVDEVKALLASGEPVTFIDARPTNLYDASDHQLPGAHRVAPEDTSYQLGRLAAATVMVVYGSADGERVELSVARALADYGYPQIAVLRGGYEAWERAGGLLEAKVALGIGPGA